MVTIKKHVDWKCEPTCRKSKTNSEKKRNCFETGELVALSTTDLQQIFLIEQLELIKRKKEAVLKLLKLQNEIKIKADPKLKIIIYS